MPNFPARTGDIALSGLEIVVDEKKIANPG